MNITELAAASDKAHFSNERVELERLLYSCCRSVERLIDARMDVLRDHAHEDSTYLTLMHAEWHVYRRFAEEIEQMFRKENGV